MPGALIIGSEGQDGRLLQELLQQKNYEVHGVGRSLRPRSGLRNYYCIDLSEEVYGALSSLIRTLLPDEIYFVAAYHHSSQQVTESNELIERSVRVNQLSFIHILEICRLYHPGARIIYTSSSLIFAGCGIPVQNERTPKQPGCIYSITKCAAMDAATYYKDVHDLFVSVAIMYNHESVFRNDKFLSKIIINETKRLLTGEIVNITIGDLSAVTDWGYAPDYVRALWHILQLPEADTFIVSSGIGRRVQDWFEVLFEHLCLDWKVVVVEDKSIVSRKKPVLIGDNSKLRGTGWHAQTSFEEMVIHLFNGSL